MAHELVFEVDENGVETGKARLALCQKGAWHGFGQIMETISIEDIHRILGTDKLVTVDDVVNARTQAVLDDTKALSWMNGNRSVHLGSIGPETGVLHNKDFVDALAPWLNAGHGTIESAGLLRGGRVIFASIKIQKLETAKIRTLKDGTDDVIIPYISLANGHGKMGMWGGRTDIRPVCANTVFAGATQMTENGSMMKKTHRSKEQKQGKSDAASAEMAKKMDAIHAFLIAQQISFKEEVDKLCFLESVQVKPIGTSINNTICKFAETIDKGKKAEDVMAASYKPGKIALEMANLFVHGIGCEGRTWFDLHAAATELFSHGKSNEMTGDRPGDAEARRHYDLWFGTRANKLDAALTVALEMAKMQA